MTTTQQQVEILQHTLGLSVGRREPYRNHFLAGPGHHDMPDLEALEASGLMCRGRTPSFCNKSDIVFLATDAGRALALERLPEPPKQTQHRQWLDADSGHSFGEWLCGHRLPKVETESEYRSVNGRWRTVYRHRMYRLAQDSHWRREVQGEWAITKKEAKASYKLALTRLLKSKRAKR